MQIPYDGNRQIIIPQPIILARVSTINAANGEVEFRVQTPDSRLQVKVSVLFAPDPPVTLPIDITDQGASILMQEEDESYCATFSGYVPLTTIVGDASGNPLGLPQNPGLAGYSRELVTAADAVHGYLTLASGESFPRLAGTWVLQTRFQPYAQRLPDAEWEEVRRLCNATLISTPLSF